MTLMPVSNISVVGVRFSTVGAERWIGQRSSSGNSIGSPWSIGSPSRLKMRPSVTSPTGTVIGPPVSTTSVPRARPSVVSMATARTRSSPRCCWTSQTRIPSSPRSIVIAELIWGSSSGKTASMTTPWISSIRPLLSVFVSVAMWCGSCSGLDQRLGAGNDFHDLLGDLGLAGAVHLQGEVFDDFAGVLAGVAHRGHAGAVLGGGALQQGAEDRDLDVVGDEALEDVDGIGLVLDERAALSVVVPGAPLLAARLRGRVLGARPLEDRRLLERQQRLAAHLLGERRDVAVVEDLHAVDVAVDVRGHQGLGDLAGVVVARPVGEPDVAAGDVAPAERQRRDAATAGGEERHLLALGLVLGGGADPGPDDLRVERAGQAAVGGDEQDRDLVLGLVLLEDVQRGQLGAGGLGGLPRHPPDRARVGPQPLDALLGAAQARGSPHLHRARDLADGRDRRDPVLDPA